MNWSEKANTDNPFCQNYLFSENDLNRAKIKKWQYPLLFFLPTYVQLSDGYEIHFKLWQGRIFLMKMVKIRNRS